MIHGEKDWKHVSMQKVVTLNTCCDVAAWHLGCHTSLPALFRASNIQSDSDEQVLQFTW